MADEFDKKIDSSKDVETKPENKLLSEFKNNLSSLASEVKDTYRNAFDKALQSLEKWLSSQEKSVQKEVVDDLDKLRSSVAFSKNIDRSWLGYDEVISHDPLYRPLSVDKEISAASASISRMIEQSDEDAHPIASVIGGWMKKIIATEK